MTSFTSSRVIWNLSDLLCRLTCYRYLSKALDTLHSDPHFPGIHYNQPEGFILKTTEFVTVLRIIIYK